MKSLVLSAVILLNPVVSVLAQTSLSGASVAPPEELIVQISMNGLPQNEGAQVVLREADSTLLFSSEGLRQLRVRLPVKPDRELDGVDYYRLTSIPGVTWTLDEATLGVALKVPAEAFDSSSYTGRETKRQSAVTPAWGVLFSYDVLGQRSSGTTQEAGSFGLGLSGPLGVGTTELLARKSRESSDTVRLNSVWTYDRPEHMATWRLGDSISRSGSGWGQSVRFAGLQYATNFATQPGMVLLPQQTVSGSAVIPSTVDVFINNSLVSRQSVPAGPFSISNIPIMAGPGQMQVVVRDQLGREQVVNSSFFGSSFLIRQGLNDFSFEAGALRNNFGVQSNDYGQHFAAATFRRGFTSWFTGEVHGEWGQHGEHAEGVSTALPLAKFGVINTTMAHSSSERGAGSLFGIGFLQQAGNTGFALNVQKASQSFWQLGLDSDQSMPELVANASMGISLGRVVSLGLGYFRQDYRETDRSPVRLATTGLTFQLPHAVFAGFNASRSLAGDKNIAAGLFVSVPMGHQGSSSVSVQRNTTSAGSTLTGVASLQQSLPVGQGLGYQLQVQQDGNLLAGGTYQSNYGAYSAQVVSQQGQVAGQLSTQGSVLVVGGRVFASRSTNDSYALVHVPGFSNVRVYNGNQLVGLTDNKGYAIVPRLMAYQPNTLSIDEQDLPLDAQVGQLQQVATPWYRSGVMVEFSVTRKLSAEMRIVDANGSPIPAGATAQVQSNDEIFTVADNGRLYLTGLSSQNHMLVEADGQRCQLDFEFKSSADPLQDLGTLTCRGVAP